MRGSPHWQPFFSKTDSVFWDQGKIRNGQFIYRKASNKGNEICRVSIVKPNFTNPEILAEGTSENPIVNFEITANKIYYTRSKFGIEVSLYEMTDTAKAHQLELPFTPGSLEFFQHSQLNDTIGVGMDGWTSDFLQYLVDPKGNFDKLNLNKERIFGEFDNIVSEQVMVTSHDGVEVPLSIVANKDIKLDGKNNLFIYVYGAYGESMSPFFSPIFLDWAAKGGILAFPHVRGGGEKGEEWHKKGMKNLKYSSWKDLNACTEYLIKENYTCKGRVSLYTSSAGGITAGMAINEHPELYASFIAEVSRLNPLALEESESISSSSYLEYGSVQDSLEFLGLIRMDPYFNLKENKEFPAVLLLPSFGDDRIPIWDNGKYIAKLQSYGIQTTPFLLDIDYNSGHENSGSHEGYIAAYAKIFSFAKNNMAAD